MKQLVPSFILDMYSKDIYRGEFNAVSMFVDLSGFTAMTDNLMQHGQHGAEVLASLIRKVFNPLIQTVYGHGGFVVGYAGDAFTALFPTTNENYINCIHGLAAAIEIQKEIDSLTSQSTEYGSFQITAKIGMALGNVTWGIVKSVDHSRAAYYFRGEAVLESVLCEERAQSGEVVVDTNLFHQINSHFNTEDVGSGYKIINPIGKLAGRSAYSLPEIDVNLQNLFLPEITSEIIRASEFRQVVNVFINFPEIDSEIEIEALGREIFSLQAQYGGTLNHIYFDDKGSYLLLFWGAPIAYENDIERALNFILDLQSRSKTPVFAGVTYSIAHAGLVGGELREEYTCLSRGMNLAARLMSAAEIGEILIDAEIARRIGDKFEVKTWGEKHLKGFVITQKVFQLISRKEGTTAFYRGELVGREEELKKLVEFTSPVWDNRYAGMIVVQGDPGIGKSRLVHTLIESLEMHDRDFAWAICQTDEILRDSLNPFRYWLRQYFAISKSQPIHQNKHSFDQKIDSLIQNTTSRVIAEELDSARPFLGSMVDLFWEGSIYEQLDAQSRFENTLIALTTLIKAESLQRPLGIFIEDIHWLDGDTLEFLPQLSRNLELDEHSLPVVIIASSRKEGALSTVKSTMNPQIIDLGMLSDNYISEMTEKILGNVASSNLQDLITKRAEGNPFFAEQILFFMKEQNLLKLEPTGWTVGDPDLESLLPIDIRSVLVARLDKLVKEVKSVVQTASILGREFEVTILSGMLREDLNLEDKLISAEQAAIWTALDELRYLFNHALLRDAAYQMQLRKRRQELHALAVETIENLYAEDIQSYLSELAYHCEKAGLIEKARYYLPLAGKYSKQNFQNIQAVDFFSRALALTPDIETKERIELLFEREEIYDLQGKMDEQLEDLTRLDEMIASVNSPLFSARIALRRTLYEFKHGDYLEVEKRALETVKMADKEQLFNVSLEAYRILGLVLMRQGKFDDAENYIIQGLSIAKKIGAHQDEGQLLNILGLISLENKATQTALNHFTNSLEIASEHNDRRGQARSLNNLGNVSGFQGDYHASQNYYEQALSIAKEIGDRPGEGLVLANLGWISGLLGEYERAREFTEQSIRLSRLVNNPLGEAYGLINLSRFSEILGDVDTAKQCAEKGRKLCVEYGDRSGEAWALTCLGFVLIETGYLEDASNAFSLALRIRRELDQPAYACEPLAGLAQVSMDNGDSESARAYLEDILDQVELEGFFEGTDEPIRVLLICIHLLESFNDARAGDLLNLAHSFIRKRSELISNEVSRQAFLYNNPYHRELLSTWDNIHGENGNI